MNDWQITRHNCPSGCQVIKHLHGAANIRRIPTPASGNRSPIRHEKNITSSLVKRQMNVLHKAGQYDIPDPLTTKLLL